VTRARRPVVHLIDGSVYVFRAYHSLPPMRAPDGTPTHAAYGFANTLIRYLREQRPSHLAVAFDDSLESFRNALEPGYKANRGETPEDLEPQLALCPEVAQALGIAAYSCPDFEADDVIATLAARLLRRGADVRIVTSDKDLAQLVREDGRVVLHDLARDATLDADGVRAKFGVDPERIPDWLGLVGDAVDNLPGVPGVGPKSAAAAIGAFGRIESIPADAEAWCGVAVRGAAALAARIDAHRARALRTRELATLRRDVPGLEPSLRDLVFRGAHAQRVETLFARLGWEKIATRVPRAPVA
jgi:5'-3' exonuclease